MKRNMKLTVIHLIVWSSVAILFCLIFFNGRTIQEWGDNQTKTILLALLFVLGFGTDLVIRIILSKEKDVNLGENQDLIVQLKSLTFVFISVLIYTFVATIILYVIYEKVGMVPVGWLWFIAYSLIIVANIFADVGNLYYHYKG